MRYAVCLLAALLWTSSAFALGPMTIARAKALAEKGNSEASAALSTTVDRDTCMSGCEGQGHDAKSCARGCRPGICHPGGSTPYCVAK